MHINRPSKKIEIDKALYLVRIMVIYDVRLSLESQTWNKALLALWTLLDYNS